LTLVHALAKLFTNLQVRAQSQLELLERVKFWSLVVAVQVAQAMAVVVAQAVIITTRQPI
jgi:hypothetical protein